jgi:hypothetical protein
MVTPRRLHTINPLLILVLGGLGNTVAETLIRIPEFIQQTIALIPKQGQQWVIGPCKGKA